MLSGHLPRLRHITVWAALFSVLPHSLQGSKRGFCRSSWPTDHRHLAYADGEPFFYLGDTASGAVPTV